MTMMAIHTFVTTPTIHHGAGALGRLPDEMANLGSISPVLVTDPGLITAGLADKVYAALGREIPTFGKVRPEPGFELVAECVALIKQHDADLVIGLGGGSSMDVAKMSAVLAAGGDQVCDYQDVASYLRPGLPCIAIPTTAGTGSEVSPAVVFADPRSHDKTGVRSVHLMPKAAILDPNLTLGLPQPITAATGMDALTHAIEGYTARAATLIGDMAAERSIALIAEHLPVAYAQGQDVAAREGQLMASYFAGLSLSIAGVGIVHALAHSLGALYHVPHGVANALFLPHAMAFNRIACRTKYANVAELMGQPTEGFALDEASELAVDAVRALSLSLDIPQRLRDLNVPHKGLDALVENVYGTQNRIIINNPRTVSPKECRELVEVAY